MVTDYEYNSQGNGFGSKSKIQVITVQPTVSYAFNDKISLGFGPTFNRISDELDSNVPLGGDSGESVKVKGDDNATGFSAGILVQPIASTSNWCCEPGSRLTGCPPITPTAPHEFQHGLERQIRLLNPFDIL